MRIIHTSDWHLGAKLHEQDRAEDQAAFLSDLRALMQSHGAEVLLISGDVFDLRQPASSAQALYYDFLAAMDECPTCKKVIVTAGNHDSASLLAASGLALKRIGVEVVSRASEDVSKEIIVLRGSEGKPGSKPKQRRRNLPRGSKRTMPRQSLPPGRLPRGRRLW